MNTEEWGQKMYEEREQYLESAANSEKTIARLLREIDTLFLGEGSEQLVEEKFRNSEYCVSALRREGIYDWHLSNATIERIPSIKERLERIIESLESVEKSFFNNYKETINKGSAYLRIIDEDAYRYKNYADYRLYPTRRGLEECIFPKLRTSTISAVSSVDNQKIIVTILEPTGEENEISK